MFSMSKGQRQQPLNSAASVGGAPASSAVAATSAEISATEPATSSTVPSAASIRGAFDARESSAGAVSSDAAVEVATSTGGTAAPVASAARAAKALASAAGSAGDSWAWAISQGRLRFYPRRRVSVRRFGKVVRLRRSLYGLNQALRTWHYHLVRGIKALGFEQCEADTCVMRLVEDGAVDIACLFAC